MVDPRVQRTRAAVLAAAVELLAEGGIRSATVQAVADRAGVNKTTVYRHWPDPHGLVVEALEGLSYGEGVPDTGTVRGDLVAMFTGLAAAMQAPPWDRLLPSVIEAAAHDDEFRQRHGQLTRSRRSRAASAVERGIARGELAASIDAEGVVEMIAGPLYYRLLMTHEKVDDDTVGVLVDRALKAAAS
jgi:AcrR family transcriptional regulator